MPNTKLSATCFATSFSYHPEQIQKNYLVFDPFVGTGSCLIPAAHFGGHVIGSDIDWRVLVRGKGDENDPTNLFSNFK